MLVVEVCKNKISELHKSFRLKYNLTNLTYQQYSKRIWQETFSLHRYFFNKPWNKKTSVSLYLTLYKKAAMNLEVLLDLQLLADVVHVFQLKKACTKK